MKNLKNQYITADNKTENKNKLTPPTTTAYLLDKFEPMIY